MDQRSTECIINIYSQNVSCDSASEKLKNIEGMEDMVFKKRFEVIMTNLSKIPNLHVIAFNEVSSGYKQ